MANGEGTGTVVAVDGGLGVQPEAGARPALLLEVDGGDCVLGDRIVFRVKVTVKRNSGRRGVAIYVRHAEHQLVRGQHRSSRGADRDPRSTSVRHTSGGGGPGTGKRA